MTFPHGTRVTVRDLFGSMPVRVKHRALQATKGISVREWDQLILDVLALLFVWPGTVIISIREMSSRQSLSLKARTGESATASHQAGFPSRVPSLLQQASFCDVTEKELWVSLGASGPGISITGCVCLVPVATKRIQFISIGIEPLSNDSQNNVLYEEINRTFANSAFGCIEEESDRKGDLPIRMEDYTTRELKPRKGVDRWPIFCLTINLDKFAEKGETGIGEIADGRDTALSDVLTLLKAMFYEFLKRHLFRPKAASLMNDRSDKPRGSSSRSNTPVIQAKSSGRQKSRTSDNELVQLSHPPLATSVSVRQEQLPERPVSGLSSSFDSWSRVKAGRILPTFKAGSGDSTTPMSTLSTGSIDHSSREIDSRASAAKCRRPEKPCLFDSAGRLTRKPFDDVDLAGCTNESNADTVPRTSLEDQETVTWFNPLTTKTAIVNSRTGFVIQPQRIASGLSLQGGRPFLNNPTKPVETNNDASWIDDILRSWNNPVFELTEAPIPRLHNALDPLGNELEGSTHQCRGHNHLSLTKSHETSVMDSPGRLHRDDLRHAQLLAQVDKKFILAKIQSHAVAKEKFATRGDIGFHEMRPLLVLIDQHAADERCRVEKLMVEYFELDFSETGVAAWRSRTESLEKPLCFELSSRERDLLERYRPHFSHWGIIYNLHINTLQSKSKHRGGTELSVTRLPPGILERCRSEPRLLIELLRKEVWKLDDEPLSSRTGPVTEEASYGTSKPKTQYEARSWVSRFHGCPQGILDLINSRACRSELFTGSLLICYLHSTRCNYV